MSDDKISINEAIDAALKLDGDPDKVRAFYEDWAQRYDIDTSSVDYNAPAISARLLQQYLAATDGRLLDAGCGTGLVGVELGNLGYHDIEGFDLSDSMAQRALATGAYRQVKGGIDMMQATQSYAAEAYDALLSVGVFTLGHVPPEALLVLLSLTRPGGLLVVSTRTHYYDQTDFQQRVDELLADGRIELQDGAAHYWVFSKTG
jgi:predicted TPR repeat methyltransferase